MGKKLVSFPVFDAICQVREKAGGLMDFDFGVAYSSWLDDGLQVAERRELNKLLGSALRIVAGVHERESGFGKASWKFRSVE